MGLSDLLELCLDLANGVVLELLDFFEGRANHAHCLRVDSGGGKDLIDLSILGLETLLNSLKFLFEDEVAETGLLVKFIHNLVELLEQLLLLGLQVLELLKLDFILPFLRLVLLLCSDDLLLAFN